MKKKVYWDYEFECVNPSDYVCVYMINTNHPSVKGNSVLMKAFKMTRYMLKRKIGKDVKGNPDVLDAFDVPEKYYNYIMVNLRKTISDVEAQVLEDGIQCITSYLDKAKFIRKDGDWHIKVWLRGEYVDRRK